MAGKHSSCFHHRIALNLARLGSPHGHPFLQDELVKNIDKGHRRHQKSSLKSLRINKK